MESVLKKPVLSPESFIRIRFQDCDPFGHLNNARYMDYFFEARSEHLRRTGNFDFYDYGNRENKSWVVAKTQLQYLEPVKLNEVVKIVTRLTKLSANGITNEDMILDKDGTRLKAVLWVDLSFVDLSKGRPLRHDPEIFSFFESLLYEEDGMENITFEARVKQLRKQVTTGKYSGDFVEY
ncbi:acyl-CoA thioester hydrolase, YbgC/YbaW family [Leptospira fainei serovar Hurstbridge str. BUT 6]|uniref:Acyl-CoA thioester hydrolase, YbgC/YbaW family n=1 Tax=Leptospira fainei serovar Hurstbridge str. BUT 6 TaxID=1193011 RepID=S3W4L5_9LEPT|nr:acyl-CoA thioesterase [Leptospira fainei]EPG75217.1 acyl-CoA thioester hydrolase, YbgC/YbaW family [Leptospira fainei serovar Hurstbridge str. BUT 6]